MKQHSNTGLAGDWRYQLCSTRWFDELPHMYELLNRSSRNSAVRQGTQGFGEMINDICNEFYDDVGNHTFALLEEAVC